MIETDFLLALISAEDKHHGDVIELLDKLQGDISLSPHSLMELDLLLRSREIIVTNVEAFYDLLGELLNFREITTTSMKPKHYGVAFKLREKHDRLRYFDSLHAAFAIVEGLELLSYDKEYGNVTGLNHRHPDMYVPRK